MFKWGEDMNVYITRINGISNQSLIEKIIWA